MSDSIKVAVKVRPLIKREKDDNLPIQWTVQGNSIISTDPEMKKRGDGGFCFDHIFDMNISNLDVFNAIVKPIVNAAVNGFNGTVFAYGQTSSGKTYTMMGTMEEPGIIPLAIEHMFDAIANSAGREFLLRVSYLEIYNERVNDLLNKTGIDLKVKEDGTGQVIVQCKEEITNSPENVLAIMKKGDKNRRIGETNMNERSSRSHTIFRITIESREAGGSSEGAIQVSQLNLVDLAGSERARQTGATGERFKEGRHINLSLSTLGLVIMQLSESQDGQKHVNFRDSKLTRLLQTSLGGNAMTAIICAITPAALEETQCTLSFASRAKSVKNKPQVNEVMSDAALLKRYAKQLAKLQAELEKIKTGHRSAEMEEMESKLQEKDRINQLLEERIELLKTRIVSGDISDPEESFKYRSKRRQTWGGPAMFNQHLPAFQPKTGLPTIKEVSFEKPERKNVLQSIEMMNQTFQTEFADFELELFESERNRESKGDGSDSEEVPYITKRKHRVTFNDDIHTIKEKNSFDTTPEKCNISTQTGFHISPSTPKQTLRQRITDLTKEFVELREFTTLEKQLMCQENCFVREEAQILPGIKTRLNYDLEEIEETKVAPASYDTECISEVKKRLTDLNLAEEKDVNRIIIELCVKLNEVEKQHSLENDEHRKKTKQYSELKKQIENTTSERNEFEYISRELRAELKKKTVELELKNMSEENIKQQEMNKISELEKKIESITFEKNQFERSNVELSAELSKKTTELQKQIEDINSERNEFEHIRRELRKELNKKSLELERLRNDSIVANTETVHDRIVELEKEIESIRFERNKFEHTNTELESTVNSERTEKQKAIEKVSELEKQIEEVVSNKNQAEKKITDLESKLLSERSINQEVTNKISELEKQIERVTFEKKELEQINSDLNNNVSELKSAIELQQTEHQQAIEKISNLEKKVETTISEKNKVECINTKLQSELDQKMSELETEAISQQPGNQRTVELEKEIENLTFQNTEHERVNNEIRDELNQKNAEVEDNRMLQEKENRKAIEKIAELEVQIESISSRNNELERIVAELNANIISEKTENQKAMETISELNKQIESITLERNKLNIELKERISEFNHAACKSFEASSKNISELESKSEYEYISENNDLKNCVKDLQDTLTNVQTENQDLKDQLTNQSILQSSKVNESNADLSSLIINIETEKSELEEVLQLKSRELEDIKNDVRGLKTAIQNLQDTIYLLTTENMEMANKLTTEQENAKQTELNLQKTIDELYMRISEVTNEKIDLESDLETLKDQLESMRSKMPETSNEDSLFATYQIKIDKLTAENIELSTSIAEKNKELESIKESKSLLFDHECIYKEKMTILEKNNKCLVAENNELSTDLIDKIEENDKLKEECDILKSKTKQLLTINENFAENEVEQLKVENNTLLAEVAELKTKVTILSDENAKFSNNLLETLEDLDSSCNEKSYNNTLHLSTIFQNSTIDIGEDQDEGNPEVLKNKVTMLQNKIDHVVRLNKKLSDLKLTSCSQCAHLRNVSESRRALKLEAKVLNQKLHDLQRKFDRKCADTEILKQKVNQDLNVSEINTSLNVSFVNEMDISFVEGKIQSLNDELETLKTDHDKLSILYEDKCNELKKLQGGMIANTTNATDNLTLKKDSNKGENRVRQMQNYISQLKDDVDEMKKNSTNFTVMFNQFKIEKAELLDEINMLKELNEELQQKVANNESISINKVQILENDLENMSKEIEHFSKREKEFESQRLMLEVAVENLKVEEENKNVLITQLNERIFCLSSELDKMRNQKNELIDTNIIQDKEEELECLKKRCEGLQKENMQSKELEQYNASKIKDMEAHINNLQTDIMNKESLFAELQKRTFYLEQLLQENEQAKRFLREKLQAAETEVIEFKNNLEMKYKNEFDSMSLQYQQCLEKSQNSVQQLNDTLNKYVDENLKLTGELSSLQSIKQKYNEMMNEKEQVLSRKNILDSDYEKLKEELDDIKTCMIIELTSLKCNINSTAISYLSINEIFVVLLEALVSKEKEVIKNLRETCEKEKRKLEDEKQQCIDMEKRTTIWAKELEAEIEKLHSDIMEREHAQKEYKNKVSQFEHLLKESTRENEILKQQVETLEADFNNVQTEFNKQCGIDNQQERAILVAQKREKEVQKIFECKEMELHSKMKTEKDMYEKKISELLYTIESYKTQNLELNSNIEGLEANEKQLKNILEANSIEMKKNNQNIDNMNAELEQFTLAYNKLTEEMDQKNSHIEKITGILKSKCDTLSEYETRLETVLSEYEMLKEHVKDQTSVIQRHKEEIEKIKKEREEQLEIIEGKLNSEEIKNAGLTKQLNELNNKNISLIEELNDLKEKYEELQEVNAKLERKIRNSTSKIKAQTEIEELKELNKTLQNNLEGARNRVIELQEAKSQTLKELVDLKGKYELTLQENAKIKTTSSSYKSKYSISSTTIDESKYDALLLEKNKIALELEGNKLILNRKVEELKISVSQVQQLTKENKELDKELDEYAAVIQEKNAEISKLEAELYEVEQKLEGCREENKKLQGQVGTSKLISETEMKMDIETEDEISVNALKGENLELQAKADNYKKELDTQKSLLRQKEKEFMEYMLKIQDLTTRNRELHNELDKCAVGIRDRDGVISKLENTLRLRSVEKSMDNTLKENLDTFKIENKKLKSEVEELEMKLRMYSNNEGVTLRRDSSKQKLQTTFDQSLGEQEDKSQQLKNKIRDLELDIVSQNGKIATLEIQIQSENFPYQKKCKELEEVVLAFRNKNAKLNSEIRKLQKTMNDVNAWECDICRRWQVNRKDQACQTIPDNAIRFCSSNSGVVEDYTKMQKLLKEKQMMKDLCRSRARLIRELENRIKELEKI
ncbi:kinesin-related protein 4-like [Osmia bicornis bicornis]|uniref:kinesin-related protein 4-like n=1 Tax=Osmia bicornis bicornis TaxID=1437191 RepID=UPI001EAF0CA2|nr:kinesin-related protein 4-like [Osmia bicornis bicornis]